MPVAVPHASALHCPPARPRLFRSSSAALRKTSSSGCGASPGYPEDARTEAKARLRVRIEPTVLRVQEEIGIPEVHVHQGIKVNREPAPPVERVGNVR